MATPRNTILIHLTVLIFFLVVFIREMLTVGNREMGTGIFEASKRVPIFSFATQGGKQVSSYF